jgi:ATP/ADP translocase
MAFKGKNSVSVDDLAFSQRWLRRVLYVYSGMWRRVVLKMFSDILKQMYKKTEL